MSSQHQPSTPPSPSPPPPRTLRIGTRSSALALAQTDLFTALLAAQNPHPPPTEIYATTTTGDHNLTSSLHTLATTTGKSLWTYELEAQLLAGAIDCIVHSLKDVPTTLPPGCVVRAVGAREDPRDVLIVRAGRAGRGEQAETTLAQLAAEGEGGQGGAAAAVVVGTSSVRRAAMIRRRYPGLRIRDVRGNVGTRLRKLDDEAERYDCLVLAGAGVLRLGLGARIASWLGREEGLLHAVGQGALGVEFRESDEWVRGLLGGSEGGEGRRVEWECAAERVLLGCLEGGCSVPVGVETTWEEEEEAEKANTGGGFLRMRAVVLSIDGSECVEGERRHLVDSDAAAVECGRALARALLERGAGRILEAITLGKNGGGKGVGE